MRFLSVAAVVWVLLSAPVRAQVSITFLDSIELPSTAVDQHGSSFTVTGLSGVTHLGGQRYAAILDNSNKAILFDLALDANGMIAGVGDVRGLTLSIGGDNEGIALSGEGLVLVADENIMVIKEHRLSDGQYVRQLNPPTIYAQRRSNLGLESLSVSNGMVWTANEEALTVDGQRASPTTGTVVRIQRMTLNDEQAGQWAYIVDAMHGPLIPFGTQGQSGLSELVALPDGRLLALERSLANAAPPFQSRIYLVDVEGATDITSYIGLIAQSIVVASKSLVYIGNHNNLEGLCLGPALTGGGRALIGVVDDGDPFSTNQLLVFRLDGLDGGSPECTGDIADDFGFTLADGGGPDGIVDFGDFVALLGLIGPCSGGVPGCVGDIADDFGFTAADGGGPDGLVDFGDFVALLVLIGPCP